MGAIGRRMLLLPAGITSVDLFPPYLWFSLPSSSHSTIQLTNPLITLITRLPHHPYTYPHPTSHLTLPSPFLSNSYIGTRITNGGTTPHASLELPSST